MATTKKKGDPGVSSVMEPPRDASSPIMVPGVD
jgi:hypothetical protein